MNARSIYNRNRRRVLPQGPSLSLSQQQQQLQHQQIQQEEQQSAFQQQYQESQQERQQLPVENNDLHYSGSERGGMRENDLWREHSDSILKIERRIEDIERETRRRLETLQHQQFQAQLERKLEAAKERNDALTALIAQTQAAYSAQSTSQPKQLADFESEKQNSISGSGSNSFLWASIALAALAVIVMFLVILLLLLPKMRSSKSSSFAPSRLSSTDTSISSSKSVVPLLHTGEESTAVTREELRSLIQDAMLSISRQQQQQEKKQQQEKNQRETNQQERTRGQLPSTVVIGP